MPDLQCPSCGKEKHTPSLSIRIDLDEVYYAEGECECGEQMKLSNPKKGMPSLGRMGRDGKSY